MAFDLDDEELEMTRVKINKLPPTKNLQIGDYFRTVDGIIDSVKGFNMSVNPYWEITGVSGRDYSTDEIKAYNHDLLSIVKRNDIVNGSRVIKIGCFAQFIKDEKTEELMSVSNGIELENSVCIYSMDKIEDVLTYEQYKEQSFRKG